MRGTSIFQWSIIGVGFLAMLLPPHLLIRALIVQTIMGIGFVTSASQIVAHNIGLPLARWGLPVGVPVGIAFGTQQYSAACARRRTARDLTRDLGDLWEWIGCEMAQVPKIWCEMTGGRFIEGETDRSAEL